MRIPCPFCGERSSREFVQGGDAAPTRPAGDADLPAYVYLRDNPAGWLEEYWYHAQGCRRWLRVTRDSRTHEVAGVRFAAELRR